MKLSKALLVLALTPLAFGQFVQMGGKLTGTGSLALSADGTTAIVGNDKLSVLARVYAKVGGVWALQGNIPGGPSALSADGNTAITGSTGDDSGKGALWVYTRSNGVWTQQGGKLVGTGMAGAAGLGGSVAVSADGNTVIATGSGDGAHGAIWVFTRTAGVWTQQGAKLSGAGAVDAALPSRLGPVALSADGNTAIAGAPYDDITAGGLPFRGAVWIFTRTDGVWTQQGDKLVAAGATGNSGSGSQVGSSVALSGDGNTALVAGPADGEGQGAVWVFTRSNGVWTQQGSKLVGSSGLGFNVNQGTAIGLSGDGNIAIAGGPGADYGKGAVWVFTRTGGVWTQEGERIAGSGVSGNFGAQGGTVALSSDGSTALIGGISDGFPLSTGATWTFIRLAFTYKIAGNITSLGSGIAGVSVGLTGAQAATVLTDAAGHFDFGPAAPGGNYTVMPYLTGHTFDPASQTVNNLGSDQTLNFTDITPLQMVSPTPGSTLTGFSTTFIWNGLTGASAYWLDVGTAPGQGNIFGANVGAATSQPVTGLPMTGVTLYVTLYANINGGWQNRTYFYTAAAGQDPRAVIASPAAGSVLSGPAVTFSWTGGPGASAYWLDVGTSAGQGNIFGGNLGTATSKLVSGLPTNGGTVYVTLYSSINLTWYGNSYTYTAASGAKAAISSPAPNSTLSGASATFTWTGGVGVTEYWLDVGTAAGQGNIFGQSVGAATSKQVSGLPMNGAPIYVSLFSKINGTWSGTSYTYTAATLVDPRAVLTSPAAGSTFGGALVTFTWSAGSGASMYWLDVGTAPGLGNIYGGNVGSATSHVVSGIPTDGGTIYVNLYSNINGSWLGNSYTFRAAQDARAAMIGPVPGSTLMGFSANFTWTPGTGVSMCWLDVGTAPSVGNIFGGNVGAATSQAVTGLPMDGSTVYASLYSYVNGAWQVNTYTYRAATGTDPRAVMISPAAGSALPGSSATFTWSAGTGVTSYWLDVGTADGQGNIFGGNVGSVTSRAVTGLPVNGRTVYVSLYSNINGAWYRNSYTYVAVVDARAAILRPAPGSTLAGFSAGFTWTPGTGATAYWLDVGTAASLGNIFGGNVGTATAHTVTGLPMDGSTVYVTLYTKISGNWQSNSYTFHAATGSSPLAAILTPAPSSVINGGSATFTWSAGTGVTSYWLDVGTTAGQGNVFGGNVGTATSQAVTGMPVTGTIYVTLYSNIGGTWFGKSYTYAAAP